MSDLKTFTGCIYSVSFKTDELIRVVKIECPLKDEAVHIIVGMLKPPQEYLILEGNFKEALPKFIEFEQGVGRVLSTSENIKRNILKYLKLTGIEPNSPTALSALI